jgi:hypothetical protein
MLKDSNTIVFFSNLLLKKRMMPAFSNTTIIRLSLYRRCVILCRTEQTDGVVLCTDSVT